MGEMEKERETRLNKTLQRGDVMKKRSKGNQGGHLKHRDVYKMAAESLFVQFWGAAEAP